MESARRICTMAVHIEHRAIIYTISHAISRYMYILYGNRIDAVTVWIYCRKSPKSLHKLKLCSYVQVWPISALLSHNGRSISKFIWLSTDLKLKSSWFRNLEHYSRSTYTSHGKYDMFTGSVSKTKGYPGNGIKEIPRSIDDHLHVIIYIQWWL